MDLPKQYEAKAVEKKWQAFWDKEKLYTFDKKSKKPVFSIDTPPPYASSGHLHVGHALHYTQFEIIARYKRMKGFNVYFPPGFDNNGLPTEKYVEEKYNISKATTTRSKFRKLCLTESKKVEDAYVDNVFKTLGHSYDWSLLYTTISPEAQKVSQTSFIDLLEKGHAYRAEEPTLWCPYHQTALAQAELENVQRHSVMNHIHFDSQGKKLEIATTRPELLPSCVAIYVNSNDKRYKDLVGKTAKVPLFNQEVKIFADENVDMEFGTGIMMVCTFGDTEDIARWKKDNLDLKVCISEDGKLNELGGKYKGLDMKEARKQIIADLEKEGRLVKQEKLQQSVNTCWRCNTPVEFLVKKQWFIHALKHKDQLIKQGKKINWYPDFYRKRFEDWTTNLAWDWCISRQRFYGVPIPVWYCKKCNEAMVPDKKDLPLDPTESKPKKKCKCGSSDFEPESDVFDTWMTSSMSPQVAGQWLKSPDVYKKVYPMSLRPQSHDIIRTWAFYTILKSYLHFDSIPWENVAIGTFVLDEHGKGMHKSKGNAVWADELLKKYNVDVFRYWVGTARWGEDLPFKEKDFVTGTRFVNKLWNASKFALMHLEDYDNKKPKLEVMDKWFLSKLQGIIKKSTESFDVYESGDAKRVVEQFFWHVFCDNYLEIAKPRLYNEDKAGKEARKSAQYTLYTGLLALLKLFAPIMPHITEEIYHLYLDKKEKIKSIHISGWPEYDEKLVDNKTEKAGDLAVDIIGAARREKSSKNLSLKTPVKELIISETDKKTLEPFLKDIELASSAEKISFHKGELKIVL
ncbi:MAG: valine--tRNA ligase [archaeon]